MSALRATIRTVGELMITFGLVVLLFVAYELWGTGLQTARAQDKAEKQLEELWESDTSADDPTVRSPTPSGKTPSGKAPSGKPAASAKPAKQPRLKPGTDFAKLRVPRFGEDYVWVIGEGTDREQLKKGPGHYPGTEMPGEVGNFVISGHRTTYQAPFNEVDLLQRGDAIVIETKTHWYTYRVTDHDIVRPDQVEVTFPVPYKQGAKPTERLITLTSCHPKFSARQRYIVFGELESQLPKTTGERPPALDES